ncbi:MAG: methyl-accepting chemotaxis protein [Bacteroidales bacterium]|nr:methyl-accepting chemotaxis protein [Bacteroidales bacterium]
MKNLKISQKLILGIAGQLVFIALLVFFVFNLNGKLTSVSEGTIKKTEQIDKIKELTALSKDFINDKVSFTELSEAFSEIEEINPDTKIQETLNKEMENLSKINKLKVENLEIENKVMKLTDESLENSNEYIYTMSEKLAHPTKRARVSTIERLVIGGANKSNNNIYTLKVLFLRMKEDISTKDDIIAALEQFIQQTVIDIERLKNTPFAELPVMANKSNEQALILVQQFISNVEEINALSTNVYASSEKHYLDLSNESISSMEKSFSGIKTSLKNVFLVLLIISITLIILNFTLSKIITLVFKQLNIDLEKITNGDLTFRPPKGFELRQDEIGGLARSIIKLLDNLKSIIGSIRSGADSIAAASQQISSGSQQLSQGASEQASSVEEVSSTMEEIAANIEQNTENAQETEKISITAQQSINDVGDRALKSIEATKEIDDKIQIINDIAFQTNILALNAAVEAARAGEHGKGFAVVAAEVRKLAERSKKAADEIVTLAKESNNLAEGTGARMRETLPQVEKTTKLLQEIAAASLEQNNGVNQINSAIQQLNNVTQQNAASSEELATSSEELASQADSLKDMVAFFKINNKAVTDNISQTFRPKTKVNKTITPIEDVNSIINLSMGKSDDQFENY